VRLLFVHKHFPGQFVHLARAFAAFPDSEVVFISTEPGGAIPDILTLTVRPSRPSARTTHQYVQPLENAVLLGQATYRECMKLREAGFVPDLIYAHAGFGPGLYLKDAFPETPIIGQFEWFHRACDSDADFLSPREVTENEALRIRTRNAALLLELSQCDHGICPTAFQMDQFPEEYHGKLHVIHEGIDTTFFSPGHRGTLTLGGLRLPAGAAIVTYAARGMEPHRGFPQFMRALATLQRLRPRLHAVIVGEDTVFHGRPRKDRKSWKQAMLDELPSLDAGRTHFTGRLSQGDFRRVLRASHAHVYLTVPFVLSRSLLQAMATGCTVVGSATAPVREIVRDGETGYLADFLDPFRLATRIGQALDDPEGAVGIGQAAHRHIVAHYDLAATLPTQFRLASHVLGRDLLASRPAQHDLPVARRA
jgi:glycosyltransferase involved in cell wall biosynthesis